MLHEEVDCAAFSGMEFTLAFLARDRYEWSPRAIGGMFVHVGLTLALVQGGLVRRLAPKYGEKKVALTGVVIVTAGLIGIAVDESLLVFWLSVTTLAVGSGFTFPTLSALVSLHASEAEQGEALGIFRALGALARVFGPFAAAVLYWRYGAEVPYWAGAAFLIVPFLLISMIPTPPKSPEPAAATE